MQDDAADRCGEAGLARSALADFLVHLGAELQVSRNTVAAYRNDLQRLLRDVDGLPDRDAIDRHLSDLLRTHAPASVARAAAAIRGFYRFLHAEGLAPDDVTDGLLGARLEQKLPKALTRRHVERMLQQDAEGDLAERDLTILHVLYATGCRVSEVVGLRTTSVVEEHRLLRAFGKGNKERLVPIGDVALSRLLRYRDEVRPRLRRRARRDPGDALFLSRTGRPLDRGRVYQVVRAAPAAAGREVGGGPPPPPPPPAPPPHPRP
ncbi:MAG: tyrosine-type recombinase/integrase, partial [Planctomycetota bacterium]